MTFMGKGGRVKKVKKSTIPFAPSEWGEYVTQEQLENEFELVTTQFRTAIEEYKANHELCFHDADEAFGASGDEEFEGQKELDKKIKELKEKKEILEKALEGLK